MVRREETVTSFMRGLSVIRSFGMDHQRQTITDVSGRTGLTRAAARRFLHTLCAAGLARTDGKYFELTPAVLELGHSFLSAVSEIELIRQVLQDLTRQFDESASCGMLDGTDVIYVARSPARHRIITINLSIGTRLPAHATSMGQALLAMLPPRELDRFLSTAKLDTFTPRTITSKAALRQRLLDVQRRGYALVSEELELGLRSLSVGIAGRTSGANMALNMSTQAARVSEADMLQRFLPALRRAARQIAGNLGGH
jgi:IclR family transcriptional regulator, pca regulon regulatory protein